MEKYEYRAVYFKNKKDGEVEYRSAPISEAEEQYDTIGLYNLLGGKENIEQNHIGDMSIEDFQLVRDSQFPNGFESWQKSHYEITLILNKKKNDKQTYSVLAQLAEFRRKGSSHALALYITNKFETFQKGKSVQEDNLNVEIVKFLESYDFKLPEVLMHII